MEYCKRSKTIEAHTFEEFIQYGRDQGVPLVNNMPWSFHYRGFPVTHENDKHYLILVPGLDAWHFKPDEMIYIKDDVLHIMRASGFDQLYTPIGVESKES